MPACSATHGATAAARAQMRRWRAPCSSSRSRRRAWAARDAHGVVAGAIYDPNRDELFSARSDGPVHLDAPAGRVRLAGRTQTVAAGVATHSDGAALATAMIATGLYYDAHVRAAQARC